MASSATVRVIIGPAGRDMQMLPPTVAEFHTLNEARNASQLVVISRAADQSAGAENAYSSRIVHIAPISRPASLAVRRAPAERHQVDESPQFRLLVGEQPGSAREEGVAGTPVCPGRIGWLPDHFGDGVDVQITSLLEFNGLWAPRRCGPRHSGRPSIRRSRARSRLPESWRPRGWQPRIGRWRSLEKGGRLPHPPT